METTPNTNEQTTSKFTWPIAIVIGALIIGGSIFLVQKNKSESIERQKQIEINYQKEVERKEALAEATKKLELDMCLEEANRLYWNYIELNGTKVAGEEDTWNAPQYMWNEAQKRKDNKEASCFKQYK